MKIAINTFFGGFSISLDAAKIINSKDSSVFSDKDIQRAQQALDEGRDWLANCYISSQDIEKRSNPILIETIEEIGCEKASGANSQIKIVEIPDGVDIVIYDYDGIESVHEVHRVWN